MLTKHIHMEIKRNLDPDLYETFKAYKVILAGGALTSIVTNKTINDYDIYLPSSVDLGEFCKELRGDGVFFTYCTEKSISAMKGVNNIQIIHYSRFESTDDIFKDFDFDCCKAVYKFENDELIIHPNFILSNSRRLLTLSGKTLFPLKSLERVHKYQKRGYTVEPSTLVKLGMICGEHKIDSWDKLNSELGGMYGLRLKSDLPEFSLDYALNNFDNLFELSQNMDCKLFQSLTGIDLEKSDYLF